MPIQTIVKNPENIKTLKELEEFLLDIRSYERENNCEAGVLAIQRRQFGSLYEIVSKEEAEKWLSKKVTPTTPEWGLKFYSRSYFENIKKELRCP
ncbi:MAG TPA: hypothetical protein VJB94_01920 [Candidatus Nanoarchaeia archaeon]|nr:hypothetical protein [Candidatus Nanoarchaeia archaeon]